MLSESTKDFVLQMGQERYAGHEDFKDIDVYLEAWQRAFIRGRYAYELLKQETDEDARRRGRVWQERRAKPEEADLTYYPLERDAAFFGLRAWIEPKLHVQ